jgi:hypothetical protein
MPNSADALRRWFGLLFLALAFGMLMWGQTVLRTRLEQHPKLFVFYWSGCFLLTFAAIVTALLDMRVTRKRAREEHEHLIQRTLDEMEGDSRDKAEE